MKKKKIRPIALCVMRQDHRILVSKGYDAVKQAFFYRPLGGGIDFGETSRDAAVREIREELEVDVHDPVLLGVLENIFVYEGEPKHEIVFVYDAVCGDPSFYDRPALKGMEGETPFEAIWLSKDQLQAEDIQLYPSGLQALLGW
jgi:8-oxo-dGTP pyrophosphatase MutT (NUDIX family)